MESILDALSKSGILALTTSLIIEGRDRMLRLVQYFMRYLKWHAKELWTDSTRAERYNTIAGKQPCPR